LLSVFMNPVSNISECILCALYICRKYFDFGALKNLSLFLAMMAGAQKNRPCLIVFLRRILRYRIRNSKE